MSPLETYLAALQARRSAHSIRRSRLPGWRIYFKAEMQRAMRKWRAYADKVRTAS